MANREGVGRMKNVLCDTQNCIYNEWLFGVGTICACRETIQIKSHKCLNYKKMTKEEQKVKREKYGFSNLY